MLIALLILLLSIGWVRGDLQHLLQALVDFAAGAGVAGAVLYALVYAVTVPLMIPASALTLGAGLVYGPWWGLAVVWPGATVGACLSYALARGTLRQAVRRRMQAHPRWAAVDDALQAQGAPLLFLLRLSPAIPFGALNYVAGLTAVRPGTYLWTTALGILPGTLLYTWIGSAASQAAGARGRAGDWLFWLGLAATGLATVAIVRVARKALKPRLEEPDG